jgi:hypothetical protein
MLAWLVADPRLPALLAGLGYTVLVLLGHWAAWGAGRWLARRSARNALQARLWPGWTLLGQAARLLLALGALFLALLRGWVTTGDVGLRGVDGPAALLWALGLGGGFALWLAFLWGLQRYPMAAPTEGGGALLVEVLRNEAVMALYRGALMPWLGDYWGIWCAVLGLVLVEGATPQLRLRLRRPAQRPDALLAWAANGVGGVLYLYAGSLWLALGGHMLCRLAVWGLWRGLAARRPLASWLAQDQGEHDEGGEHAGRDDAQAL